MYASSFHKYIENKKKYKTKVPIAEKLNALYTEFPKLQESGQKDLDDFFKVTALSNTLTRTHFLIESGNQWNFGIQQEQWNASWWTTLYWQRAELDNIWLHYPISLDGSSSQSDLQIRVSRTHYGAQKEKGKEFSSLTGSLGLNW